MRCAPLEPLGNEFKHCVALGGAACGGLDHGFSQPCATFTLKRAHVMSCLIHDSRLTSAIDLGHTLPPCLSPYLATAALLDQASSLVVAPPCDVHACIYASMHHALMVNLGWE